MTKDKGRKAVEQRARALGVLTVEYVPAASIKPNSYNPNRQAEHEFELLKRSMREDGFTQPIVCQRETREIVDGEHRWLAAGALSAEGLQGFDPVPVVFVDMTPEQMRVATLRHNRARGSEEIELTAQVLRDLQQLGALDWAQDALLLDDVELQRLLEDVPAPEMLAADQFSQAWEPRPGDHVALEDDLTEGRDRGVAATPEAERRLRDYERRVRESKDQQDRERARAETNVYRLVLIFAGEEADLVKKAVGDRPAERVLGWCRGVKP